MTDILKRIAAPAALIALLAGCEAPGSNTAAAPPPVDGTGAEIPEGDVAPSPSGL